MFDQIAVEVASTQTEGLTRWEAEAALRGLPAVRSALDAFEVRLARRIDELADRDGGVDARGSLLADERRSKPAARQAADRAEALAELPSVAGSFSDGNITTEQVDTLARAAKAVSPAAVEASDLLESAEGTNVNLTNKTTAEWIKQQRSAEDRETRHARHRRDRNASCRIREEDEAWTMFLQGDQETGARIEAALDAETGRLWRADGGRDGSPNEVRTHQQRRYDAALNLLCGARADDSVFTPIRNQVIWGVTDPGDRRIDLLADLASAGSGEFESDALSIEPVRPVVTDLRTGNVLPATVLERLMCDAEVVGLLFDTNGDILWSGRKHRTAPPKLCRALIARDKGCVNCGAPPGRCEVHHLIEWERGGTTDPDNCVLLCSRCHHDLHDRGIHLDNPTMNRLTARQRRRGETLEPPGPCAPTRRRRARRLDRVRR